MIGCTAEETPGLPGDVELRSEHFVYHSRAGDPEVCQSLLDRLEQHAAVILSATGLSWPEGRMIHYYKYLDHADYQAASPCSGDSAGCAIGDTAHSSQALHEHELVHAYLGGLGQPPRILSEGVASVLACVGLQVEPSYLPDWRASEGPVAYDIGRLLVGHLLVTYGWQAFLALYAGPWYERSNEELEARFEAIYGASIDSEWAAATAEESPARTCVVAWQCASQPLGLDEPQTPRERCGDSRVRSFVAEEGQRMTWRTEGSPLLLQACPNELGLPVTGDYNEVFEQTFTELRAGRYFVTTDGETVVTREFGQGSMFGTECDALDAVPLQVPAVGTSWIVQPYTSPYFLRLGLSRRASVAMLAQGAPVRACTSCDETAACVALELGAAFEAESEVVLRFPAGTPASGLVQIMLEAE